MTLMELQAWVRRFDEERGWDEVDPAHIALHLMEELGEIARETLRLKAYKDGEASLAGEMADLLILLAKLANTVGVDLERSVSEKMQANEARFPLELSRQAIERYRKRKAGG